MQLHNLLREYLATHGYWVLFIGTFLEGEVVLILAGFLAFEGYLTLPGVILAAWAGSFTGDQIYFYLGRIKGRFLLKRFHSIARKFREAMRLVEKYGTLVAFISRYTYGLRIILPIILGLTKLSPRRFFLLNLLSALSWASLFALGGYLFGKSAALLFDDVSRYEHWLMLALLALMAAVWAIHFFHAWRLKKPARDRLARLRAYHATRSIP